MMTKRPLFLAIALGLLWLLPTSPAQAQPQPLETTPLPGKTLSGSWNDLGRAALPQAVSDAHPWKEGAPQQTGEAPLLLRKASGSGFAVRHGLYSGGAQYKGPLQEKLMGGTIGPDDIKLIDRDDFSNLGVYEITSNAALPELKNLVLTLRIIGLPQSEHYTPFELIERAFPAALYINDLKEPISATVRRKLSKGLANGFPEETFALQWDLSKTPEPVRTFRVEWTLYPHASLTGARVDQSTQYAPLPEPTPAPATAPVASAAK